MDAVFAEKSKKAKLQNSEILEILQFINGELFKSTETFKVGLSTIDKLIDQYVESGSKQIKNILKELSENNSITRVQMHEIVQEYEEKELQEGEGGVDESSMGSNLEPNLAQGNNKGQPDTIFGRESVGLRYNMRDPQPNDEVVASEKIKAFFEKLCNKMEIAMIGNNNPKLCDVKENMIYFDEQLADWERFMATQHRSRYIEALEVKERERKYEEKIEELQKGWTKQTQLANKLGEELFEMQQKEKERKTVYNESLAVFSQEKQNEEKLETEVRRLKIDLAEEREIRQSCENDLNKKFMEIETLKADLKELTSEMENLIQINKDKDNEELVNNIRSSIRRSANLMKKMDDAGNRESIGSTKSEYKEKSNELEEQLEQERNFIANLQMEIAGLKKINEDLEDAALAMGKGGDGLQAFDSQLLNSGVDMYNSQASGIRDSGAGLMNHKFGSRETSVRKLRYHKEVQVGDSLPLDALSSKLETTRGISKITINGRDNLIYSVSILYQEGEKEEFKLESQKKIIEINGVDQQGNKRANKLEKQYNQLQVTLGNTQAELSSIKETQDKLNSEKPQDEILIELKDKLTKLEEENTKLKGHIEELKEPTKEIVEDNSDFIEEANLLKAKIDALHGEIRQLKEKIAKQEVTIADLKTPAKAISEDNSEMNLAMNQLRTKNDALQGQIRELKEQMEKSEKTNDQQQNEEKEENQESTEDHQREMALLTLRLSEAQESVDTLRKEIQENEAQENKLSLELQKVKDELFSKNKELEINTIDSDAHKKEIEKLKATFKEQKDGFLEKLNDQETLLNKLKEQYSEEMNKLQGEIQDQKAKEMRFKKEQQDALENAPKAQELPTPEAPTKKKQVNFSELNKLITPESNQSKEQGEPNKEGETKKKILRTSKMATILTKDFVNLYNRESVAKSVLGLRKKVDSFPTKIFSDHVTRINSNCERKVRVIFVTRTLQ